MIGFNATFFCFRDIDTNQSVSKRPQCAIMTQGGNAHLKTEDQRQVSTDTRHNDTDIMMNSIKKNTIRLITLPVWILERKIFCRLRVNSAMYRILIPNLVNRLTYIIMIDKSTYHNKRVLIGHER